MMNIGNTVVAELEDFAVSINGDSERTYVELDGVEYPNFRAPYSRQEIESALNDYAPDRPSTDPLSSIGSTLFNALFSGEVGRTLWRRMAEAERKGAGLRLRIRSNLERTQHLPWELLFDPSRNDFISLSGRVAIVRTRPDQLVPKDVMDALPQLRVLAVTADFTGELRTNEDLAILQRFAAQHPDRMVLTILDQASPELLRKRLSSETFDVFHFAGSGVVLPEISKRGGIRQALQLMNIAGSRSNNATTTEIGVSAGITPLLDRQELGKLLKKAGVRLAVLNACHTDWIARSVAKYIPSVIGFREIVRIESCLTFCDALYRPILAGAALDTSVTTARQAMNRLHPGLNDWCKIIFYLQQPTGAFLLAAVAQANAVEAVASPGESKEVLKLTRLLELHERNLAVLNQNLASAPGIETYSTQVDEVQRKADDVRQQLAAARAPSGTD
ncbi:MAG: CHAT domain-containing protein [Gemmatimonadaceae bacterium]